jgi:A/G-specific adenine glycosylase
MAAKKAANKLTKEPRSGHGTTALPRLRSALVAWYDSHARDLPWRRTRDPYAIWVSEVMLQQTRVDTVIPYYQRFLARFPSATALADAPEDAVLAAWSGLGYYRRARMLHGAARVITAQHGGAMPREPEARRALPGVGRYTAGAIGSIAFDLPEPIVDGNVARVLARCFAIATPLGQRETELVLWELAEALVAGERPGTLNQALMELGATVCTPERTRCDACPWQSSCRAHAEGRVGELPVPAKAKAPRSVALCALRAHTPDGRVWLVRSDEGLFHGLWGLPVCEGAGLEAACTLRDQLGLGKAELTRVGEVKHVLTHRLLTVEVYELRATRAPAPLRAVAADELAELGVSRLTKKLLTLAPEAQLTLGELLEPAPTKRASPRNGARPARRSR